eukprot:3337692-Prymnesium_polylepis.1
MINIAIRLGKRKQTLRVNLFPAECWKSAQRGSLTLLGPRRVLKTLNAFGVARGFLLAADRARVLGLGVQL